jgi:hypothetical protein
MRAFFYDTLCACWPQLRRFDQYDLEPHARSRRLAGALANFVKLGATSSVRAVAQSPTTAEAAYQLFWISRSHYGICICFPADQRPTRRD